MIDNLESERLILEPISIQHVTNVYLSWLNDEDIIKHLVTKKGHTLKSLSNYIQSHLEKKTVMYAIIIKESNRHIGNIKIDPIDYEKQYGVYGIMIGDKNYWGMGIAREASLLVIDFCFNKLNLKSISLAFNKANVSALKLYEKIGFIQEVNSYENKNMKQEFDNNIRMNIFKKI